MRHLLFSPSRLFSFTALLSACAVFSAPSLAQMVTDDTGVQGAGGNQLEVSYDWERTRSGGETERVYSIPVTYTYGLTDSVDIFASVAYARIRVPGDRVDGFGNTAIGGKWNFFENEASGTSLAIGAELALPVSSQRERDGLGTGKTSGSVNFILSQEVPFGAVHVNAGWGRERFRQSEDNATNRHFSVAPVWEIADQWQLTFDTGIDWSRSGGETVRSKYAAMSVIYSPNEDLDLEVGYMRATDDESPRARTHSVAATLSWRF
ncbi:MAG: transporter [Candidatus Accumulibacter sp.]|nr:transporter [Accumulibacter sp.]